MSEETENLEDKTNGELIMKFWNARVNEDVTLQDQIEATMRDRNWTVDTTYGNPTWTNHNRHEPEE